MYGHLIEDLDKLTANFKSIEDLLKSYPEEVYGENVLLYDPVIIVDKDETDLSKSYPIYEIVFSKDAEELKNKNNIKIWLLEYLTNNVNDISKFRGINEIYDNLQKKYPTMAMLDLINNTVKIYFKEENYKRYREAYFKLKELDYKRVKKDEIHR